MTTQTHPEAIMLADELDNGSWIGGTQQWCKEAAAELRRLHAENRRLEQLCDATYVAQGADAYNHACDEMERWQKDRAASGKDVGTTGSLVGGIAWLYSRIAQLEVEIDHKDKYAEQLGRDLMKADREIRQLRSRPALTDEQIEAAAQKLAERLDYPWEYMANTGRDHMRSITKEIMQIAHGIGDPT